jgi:valyl-tRNA synthetase
MNMERAGVEGWVPTTIAITEGAPLEDRWIFSRLRHCSEQVNRALETYRYHEAAQTLWEFFWHEFCDWYVELKKLRFKEGSGLTDDWRNLLTVFEAALRLLHPVMPFITEELWQRITEGAPGRVASIAVAEYPVIAESLSDAEAEEEMGLLQEIITAARNIRAEVKDDPKQRRDGTVYSSGPHEYAIYKHRQLIEHIANLNLKISNMVPPKQLAATMRTSSRFALSLDMPQAQADAQRMRLVKELQQLEKIIAASERQLQDDTFLSRAPKHVVDSITKKLAEYTAQRDKCRAAMESLASS